MGIYKAYVVVCVYTDNMECAEYMGVQMAN